MCIAVLEHKFLNVGRLETVTLHRSDCPERPAGALEGTMADFAQLAEDLLATILCFLDAEDIMRCACVCTSFNQLVLDESKVWEPVCWRKWGALTNLSKWIQPPSQMTPPVPGICFPHNYKMLSCMLTDLEPMVGLWQERSDQNPAGSLHRIYWEDDGLLWSRLKASRTLDIQWEPLLKFSHGTLARGRVIDEVHLVISNYSEWYNLSACSGAAAAAASVAVGTIIDSDNQGSPPRSYEKEMQTFMNSSVLRTRSKCLRKGKRNANGSGKLAAPVPKIHHLTCISSPRPTRNTSLAGLWKGVYGGHGLEIIRVDYDYTGQCATIVATKITGDRNIPAGKCTWKASAKTCPLEICTAAIRSDSSDFSPINVYVGSGQIAGFLDYTRLDENFVC